MRMRMYMYMYMHVYMYMYIEGRRDHQMAAMQCIHVCVKGSPDGGYAMHTRVCVALFKHVHVYVYA
jgi:hypothetical protein